VIWWEQRLAEIAMKLPAVTPPPHVWTRIEQHTSGASPRDGVHRSGTRWWQALAASLAVIAIGLATVITVRTPEVQVQAVQPSQVAIVADATAPLWVINAFPENEQLRVRALRAISIEANRVYELWMLPNAGTAPVSLGLLPASGEITLPLTAASAQILAASSTLAVSVEPPGGSPTGAPTGPVVFTAPLVQVRG
jgi:anti-sigma-K factor RskA